MKEYQWNEIKDETDIQAFMSMFGYFHDGCLKELRYISGAYVQNNLSMYPLNDKRSLYVVFQRQYNEPAAIEMLFEELCQLNLRPANEEYTCEIHGATMCMEDGCMVWFDSDWFRDDYKEMYGQEGVTWIKAKRVKWRAVEDYLGEEEIYLNSK